MRTPVTSESFDVHQATTVALVRDDAGRVLPFLTQGSVSQASGSGVL